MRLPSTDNRGSLKIFILNIRSLPKHKGELMAYLSNFKPFDILVFIEIGRRNIDTVCNHFEDYQFFFELPVNNDRGGVAVYVNSEVSQVHILEELKLKRMCQCLKCQFESISINFNYADAKYTVFAIYRHPKGNIQHFLNSLEDSLENLDKERTWIVTGDINIDLIRYDDGMY